MSAMVETDAGSAVAAGESWMRPKWEVSGNVRYDERDSFEMQSRR
jgi:hypothetical protein